MKLPILAKLKDPRINWKCIVIIIILAFLINGGFLAHKWWVTRTPKKEKVTELKEEKLEEKEKTDVGGEMDNRILLTRENLKEVWEKECPPPTPETVEEFTKKCEEMNYDPPTTEVLYSNKEKGISLKIPYNPRWGNKKFKILPYYEYEDRLEFGPLTPGIPTGWRRAYTMFFKPSRTVDEVITSLLKEGNRVIKDSIVVTKINDVTIVKYSTFEEMCPPCGVNMIEIIGKKYNYLFEDLVLPGTEELLSEKIIKTIKFIEY
jgi:hypothetical protein